MQADSTLDTPLLSIVTVSRNAARTIGETLRSVDGLLAAQPGVEHLVLDGLSTDGTQELVGAHPHARRHLASEADNGLYDAMNKGLQRARGEYVWFLNADDLLHPDVAAGGAAEVIAILGQRRPHILVGEVQMFKTIGSLHRPTRYWRVPTDVLQALRFGWHPPHPAFVARRRFLMNLGGFDERKRIAADFKLMTQAMRAAGVDVAIVARPLVAMREGGVSNGSLQAIFQANRECYAALRELGMSRVRAVAGIGIKLARKVGQKFVSARNLPAAGRGR
jgi:hypothetical protein